MESTTTSMVRVADTIMTLIMVVTIAITTAITTNLLTSIKNPRGYRSISPAVASVVNASLENIVRMTSK